MAITVLIIHNVHIGIYYIPVVVTIAFFVLGSVQLYDPHQFGIVLAVLSYVLNLHFIYVLGVYFKDVTRTLMYMLLSL